MRPVSPLVRVRPLRWPPPAASLSAHDPAARGKETSRMSMQKCRTDRFRRLSKNPCLVPIPHASETGALQRNNRHPLELHIVSGPVQSRCPSRQKFGASPLQESQCSGEGRSEPCVTPDGFPRVTTIAFQFVRGDSHL